ncbi:MAG: transcription elongation factor GreA [Candidatus Yanofskybacteria bacterium]|nr:transcription elongation factor GreA [Candidatus Yanofskybacteria bacterium]
MSTQYFSPEGLEKLKKELEERREQVRPEVTRKILAAKELGDLSENAEYIEAKEMQSFNEGRIGELEDMIKSGVLISPHQKVEVVVVGSTVRVKSGEHGEQKFTIVGAAESNPVHGFISNESPLGTAFLGRKKNEEIEVKTPGGMVSYKILEIN